MQYNDSKSIYLQIADMMVERILSGFWEDGERIPSIRETAVEQEVNPNTVNRTYGYLQDLEIIFNKRGIGYFTSRDASSRARKLKRQDFIRNVLPGVFHSMELLDIDIEEFEQLFTSYKEEKRDNENEVKQ